jgi:hypothetical protein
MIFTLGCVLFFSRALVTRDFFFYEMCWRFFCDSISGEHAWLNRNNFSHALTSPLPETTHSWAGSMSGHGAEEMTSFGRLALLN